MLLRNKEREKGKINLVQQRKKMRCSIEENSCVLKKGGRECSCYDGGMDTRPRMM